MSEKMKKIFYNLGVHDASMLRNEAVNLTGTEIIRREMSVPNFDPQKDYTSWPAGAPVADEDQVWVLIQPHNAAYYEGRPATLRALWGLCHTKDADKAKPWVDAYGTSGAYMKDECYRADDGTVYRALEDGLIHPADALPEKWEAVAA